MTRRLNPIESDEQQALFSWAEFAKARYPELELLFHVPNEGERDGAAAGWYQRMGLKPGVPDLHLPVARNGKHGLWIELKRRTGGRITPSQHAWLKALDQQGYAVKIAYGAEEAIRAIEDYLCQSAT